MRRDATVKRFRIRTALTDGFREAEIRARKQEEGWEAQIYLLRRPNADPVLAEEEKMGTAVRFFARSEAEALEEMMRHLKQYFRLEIEEV